MCSTLRVIWSGSDQIFSSPLQTLLHEVDPVSPVCVAPGVDDGVAGREGERLKPLVRRPESPASEAVVDLQLASVLVVGELTADLAVSTTGGILHTVVIFSTNGSCLHFDVFFSRAKLNVNYDKSSPCLIFGYAFTADVVEPLKISKY